MARLVNNWRGWVGVALALSLAAAVVVADLQLQNTVKQAYVAAVSDAEQGRSNLQDIDDLVGRTLAAIELSVLAADETGAVTLDALSRRRLSLEVDAIAASAEVGLAQALDSTIDLDARLDTLATLSGNLPERLITPDAISLRGTIVEAANTAQVLLAIDGPLSADQIGAMRGRLDGAKSLGAELDNRIVGVVGTLDGIRSKIRWRIHLLALIALAALAWFGYEGWRSAVAGPQTWAKPSDGAHPDPD